MRSIPILITAALFPCHLLAQPDFITSLYPPPHGLNIPADTALVVGLPAPLDPASLSDSAIVIWSDITGLHRWQATLEDGDTVLRIVPRHWRLDDRPAFNAGERVTVTLTTRLRYADGRPFDGFTWHYTVAVLQGRGGTFTGLAIFGGYLSTYFNVSDFNGDGWADLVGNYLGVEAKMAVYFNEDNGTLRFSHIDAVKNTHGEAADLDRDGDQDISDRTNQMVYNDGQGNFTVQDIPGVLVGGVKAHDFNNDGILDFAIGSATNDTVVFGLSENETSFAITQFALPPIRPEFYYPGISYDLNNDGRIDLLHNGRISNQRFGFVRYLDIGSNDTPTPLYYDTQFQVRNFYGNDFDGDGHIDYIFLPGRPGGHLQYMNDGSGALLPDGLYYDSTGYEILGQAVTGGDFDGDGDIDLAFANSNMVSGFPVVYEPYVQIYLNDGQGNFTPGARIDIPINRLLSDKLEAVDLDNDGDLDLIGVASGLFYVIANDDYAVAVQEPDVTPPTDFALEPIFPNPVRNQASIRLQLPERITATVTIAIFDITGRLVKQWHFSGPERNVALAWNVRDQQANRLANGVYFVRAQMGAFRTVQKFLLVR